MAVQTKGVTMDDQRALIEMFKAFMNMKQQEQSYTVQDIANRWNMDCMNCGRKGHTKEQCWQEGGGRAGMRPQMDQVKCQICGEYRHFPSQCKKQVKQANAYNKREYGCEYNKYEDQDKDEEFDLLFVAAIKESDLIEEEMEKEIDEDKIFDSMFKNAVTVHPENSAIDKKLWFNWEIIDDGEEATQAIEESFFSYKNYSKDLDQWTEDEDPVYVKYGYEDSDEDVSNETCERIKKLLSSTDWDWKSLSNQVSIHALDINEAFIDAPACKTVFLKPWTDCDWYDDEKEVDHDACQVWNPKTRSIEKLNQDGTSTLGRITEHNTLSSAFKKFIGDKDNIWNRDDKMIEHVYTIFSDNDERKPTTDKHKDSGKEIEDHEVVDLVNREIWESKMDDEVQDIHCHEVQMPKMIDSFTEIEDNEELTALWHKRLARKLRGNDIDEVYDSNNSDYSVAQAFKGTSKWHKKQARREREFAEHAAIIA